MGWRYLVRSLPTDAAGLEHLAMDLGVSLFATAEGGGGHMGINTWEVQRRIQETLRHRRDSWLWLIALASAVAPVVSACAAWTAMALHRGA
jgi:hypothetical protein